MNSKITHKVPVGRKQHAGWKGRVWSSNIFSILLIVLLIASVIKVGKEVMLRLEIHREIQNLQAQLDDVQAKKDKMDKFISYLETSEYIEKQARLELNLSKPGEKQINLVDNNNLESGKLVEDKRSNPEKWYNYFFD